MDRDYGNLYHGYIKNKWLSYADKACEITPKLTDLELHTDLVVDF